MARLITVLALVLGLLAVPVLASQDDYVWLDKSGGKHVACGCGGCGTAAEGQSHS